MDRTLTSNDAGKILVELLDAQNRAHILGLMMNIKPRDVDATQATYQQPIDRLYHIIIAFLNQAEPKPTWGCIVGALRSPAVNLLALARRIEEAHLLNQTSTSAPPLVSGEFVIN